ncbi:MAG TPA: SRPBCC family protein [Candidatus Thermoplasmatota archaeon]|nr:SRPBCC family protein [Candidatus Thermoplasmatota archaeon]
MPTVDKSIEVAAPVDRVYNLWTDFERFPSFMENVEEVRRTGPDATHWRVEAAGQTVEWDARTTALEPNRRVAWQAVGGSGQSGEVRFEPVGAGKTRVSVKIDWALPSGVKQAVVDALGVDERLVERDLEAFRRLAESPSGVR